MSRSDHAADSKLVRSVLVVTLLAITACRCALKFRHASETREVTEQILNELKARPPHEPKSP